MVTKRVSGLFRIAMKVIDSSGSPLAIIDTQTAGASHVIDIKNISSLPREARVVSILPNKTARIEFVPAAYPAPTHGWSDDTLPLASKGTGQISCPVQRNSGTPSLQEPIQCHEVHERRSVAGAQWNKLTSKKVPFQMHIRAS